MFQMSKAIEFKEDENTWVNWFMYTAIFLNLAWCTAVHCRALRCVVLLSIIYGTNHTIITYKFNIIAKLESVRQSSDNTVDKKKSYLIDTGRIIEILNIGNVSYRYSWLTTVKWIELLKYNYNKRLYG